MQSPFFLDFQV